MSKHVVLHWMQTNFRYSVCNREGLPYAGRIEDVTCKVCLKRMKDPRMLRFISGPDSEEICEVLIKAFKVGIEDAQYSSLARKSVEFNEQFAGTDGALCLRFTIDDEPYFMTVNKGGWCNHHDLDEHDVCKKCGADLTMHLLAKGAGL